MAIKIGIVHDDVEMVQKLRTAIESYRPFLRLDFACPSLAQFIQEDIVNDYATDIVLLDMDMHNDSMAGFKVIDRYQQVRNKPKIIVVSEWCDVFMVRVMKSKQSAGISGCITSDNLFDNGVLQDIIERVHAEEGIFITDADKLPLPNVSVNTPTLTDREKRILQFLASGLNVIAIAQKMGIKEGGIYATLFHLRQKFNVRATAQLILATQHLI